MTFVDRFTAANSTNLHGRTPSGAPNAYSVTAGSFSVQGNEAQSGASDSAVYIDTEEADLILSVIVRVGGGSTYNQIRFRWDVNAGTGWFVKTNDGSLNYWNGSSATEHDTLAYNLHGNGNQYYFEVDLTDPANITARAYNLQFPGYGWLGTVTASSSLNNDKTSVGFVTSDSGVKFDCLRCQSGSFDYPYQGLLEARIQKGILQDHVPYIISSYDTGTPARTDVWGENSTYSPYYDGPSALLQLYDLWGATDGALFYEAAWKQFEILHDDYYLSTDPDYYIPGPRSFSRGPYQLWGRMADADAYATVRYLPQRAAYHASGDCSIDGHDSPDYGRHRECAYALASIVWQHKIGGVAASEVDATRWGVLRDWCYEWVDYWCDEVTPGVYAWDGTDRQVAAFMIGLMLRSLWDDYTESSDARFSATLLKGCNFVWDNFWLPGNSPPALRYQLNPDGPDYGATPDNTLNNLITAAFAKCAQLTNSQTHMDRADTLNSHVALYGDFSSGGKQKNQATTWLKDYIDWRAAFSPLSPVVRSGTLFRRSSA